MSFRVIIVAAQDVSTDVDEFDPGFDPSLEEMGNRSINVQALIKQGQRIAIARTSDRSNFRRCRRRWGWQSHLKGNLTPKEHAAPLWTGSGFHYALEDFHGPRNFQHPREAFVAYVKATKFQAADNQHKQMPWNWREQTQLAVQMLDYYADEWLIARDPLQTFIFNGVPQVEVHALIPVPFTCPWYDAVYYASTFDRVIIDEHEQLWILEYKTAKRIFTMHYQTDPQCGAYQWVGNHLYGRPIKGIIYQQHRKDIPEDPTIKADGTLSTNQSARTTHRHYRQALKKLYTPDSSKWPIANIDHLNWLERQETPDYDKFVRRDRISRNQHQCEAEGAKLIMELEEMLNPNLALYPSPTRDCAGLCNFHNACISLDDGSDYEYELELAMTQKDPSFDSWRKYLS